MSSMQITKQTDNEANKNKKTKKQKNKKTKTKNKNINSMEMVNYRVNLVHKPIIC